MHPHITAQKQIIKGNPKTFPHGTTHLVMCPVSWGSAVYPLLHRRYTAHLRNSKGAPTEVESSSRLALSELKCPFPVAFVHVISPTHDSDHEQPNTNSAGQKIKLTNLLSFWVIVPFSSFLTVDAKTLLASLAKSKSLTSDRGTDTMANASLSSLVWHVPICNSFWFKVGEQSSCLYRNYYAHFRG